MKIGQGFKSVVGFLLGVGAAKRIVRSFQAVVWDSTAREGYQNIRRAVELVRQADRSPCGPETFEGAVKRLGLTESDLVERRMELTQNASTLRALGYITIIAALVSGYFAENIWWYVLYILNGFAISAMFFARTFRDAFRAWQIERRELAPVRAYMADNGLVKTLCW